MSSLVFASTSEYDLKIELSLKGKYIASTQIITREGETSSITQESNGEKIFMDVVASEKLSNNRAAIFMKFVVGTLSADGKKTIVATPQIVALESEKAQITVGDEQVKEDISLPVIATHKHF